MVDSREAGDVRAPESGFGSPPLKCIFGHIPCSRRWNRVRYSGMQLDTARYVSQLGTVGYSGIQWICCKMARYRLMQQRCTGYQGYGEI